MDIGLAESTIDYTQYFLNLESQFIYLNDNILKLQTQLNYIIDILYNTYVFIIAFVVLAIIYSLIKKFLFQ